MKFTRFLPIASIISMITVLPANAVNMSFAEAVKSQSSISYQNRDRDFADAVIEARKRIIESNLKNIEVKEEQEDSLSMEIEELKVSNEFNFKNFILTHNPKIQISLANNIVTNVKKYSKENNVDPKLVLALMAKESSFRTSVVSTSGAIGLGQLKRGTALEVGVSNPFNAIENIKGTTRYLAKLSKIFNGDLNKTLASYYMGPGALKRSLQAGKQLPANVSRYVSKIKNFKSTI